MILENDIVGADAHWNNPFYLILSDFPKNVSLTERLSNNYFINFQRFNWKDYKVLRNVLSHVSATRKRFTVNNIGYGRSPF